MPGKGSRAPIPVDGRPGVHPSPIGARIPRTNTSPTG
jgi:hypothetical protein